jgi:hypothetical protein
MEKNLNKYVTLEEAAKGNYITPQMITILVQNNRLPFFCDKGTIKVFPGDVAAALSEMFGVEEKKVKKKAPIPETPPEEVIVPAE